MQIRKDVGVKKVDIGGQLNTFILGYEEPEYIPPSPDKSPEKNASPSPEQNPKSSSGPSKNIKQILIIVIIVSISSLIIITLFIFCSD